MRDHRVCFYTSAIRLIAVSTAAAVLGMLVGCGGGDSAPPQTPTPVVTTRGVVVTLPSMLAAGESLQAAASATMSDGTTRAVTVGFRSDVPAVATVTDAGMVTAVAAGRANIYVISDGQQGTANIQVAPSYAGDWSGSYYVNSCSQSGDFEGANFCATFTPNRVLPYNMRLTQKAGAVSGDFFLGSIPFGQASGMVGGAGELLLPGTYTEDTFSIVCTWTLTSPAAGRLNGTMRHVWRDTEASGELVVTGTIRDSMKLATPAGSGDAVVFQAVQRWLQGKRR